MTSLAILRQELLTDPEVKAKYDRLGPILAVVGEMIEARLAAGLTQADIANRKRHRTRLDQLDRPLLCIGRLCIG